MTDPAGQETRTYTDALGRTVRTVQAFTDGVVTDSSNATTGYTYNSVGTTSLKGREMKWGKLGEEISRKDLGDAASRPGLFGASLRSFGPGPSDPYRMKRWLRPLAYQSFAPSPAVRYPQPSSAVLRAD